MSIIHSSTDHLLKAVLLTRCCRVARHMLMLEILYSRLGLCAFLLTLFLDCELIQALILIDLSSFLIVSCYATSSPCAGKINSPRLIQCILQSLSNLRSVLVGPLYLADPHRNTIVVPLRLSALTNSCSWSTPHLGLVDCRRRLLLSSSPCNI